MKTRIIIICAVVLTLCAWLLLRRETGQQKTDSHDANVSITNQPSQWGQSKVMEQQQSPNVPKPPDFLTNTPVHRSTIEISNDYQQSILAVWQQPINFYGKVVDENTNPIEGASIQFSWSEEPTETGERISNTTSDYNGLFSLNDKRGANLGVSVSKAGYYTSGGSQRVFSYSIAFPGKFSPDPQNPVIFNLRKKGSGENLIVVKQNYRVARDGTPLRIDLTTGKTVTGDNGDLVVQCWTDDQGKPSGAKYDWRCVVTIPGGGLVPSNEEFAFLAPENGYALTNEIVMPADRPDWRNDVDLKFFYRLSGGRYGRMTFSMIAGGQHFCMIDLILNPTGSRNLEPQ